MKIDDCFLVGQIVKTHGLSGEVTVELDVDNPEEYFEMESVLLEKEEKLIPFFIESLQPTGNKVQIKFEEVDDKAAASELVGTSLYLPLSELPVLHDDQYYFHELIGFKVFQDSKFLGTIESVYQPSSQWLAAIQYEGREILVPLVDDIVISVDKPQSKVQVKLPDGLLEVFE